MNQFIKYVGLDTHMDTIAVAIADAERYPGLHSGARTAAGTEAGTDDMGAA